jgi:type IV secretion system protein VirB10
MVSGINSDLPGNLIAQVSQNVYDTATGRSLLTPQGSTKLYGVYDSRMVYGQQRVLIAWNRIIFPDGPW